MHRFWFRLPLSPKQIRTYHQIYREGIRDIREAMFESNDEDQSEFCQVLRGWAMDKRRLDNAMQKRL